MQYYCFYELYATKFQKKIDSVAVYLNTGLFCYEWLPRLHLHLVTGHWVASKSPQVVREG